MSNPYRSYFENQVRTASPEKIMIMLYDGAIRFLRQARQALGQGDRAGKLKKVSRAVAIITELSNTLDHEKGGEVVENLDGLYWFMIRELTRGNVSGDQKPIDVCENILLELREGWVQAIENQQGAGVEQENKNSPGYEEDAAGPVHRFLNVGI